MKIDIESGVGGVGVGVGLDGVGEGFGAKSVIREVLHTPTAAVRCEKHTPAFFATGSFKSMSWPRAAQPTELAAWRRRRQQDGAIRAFRRGRLSDSEFRTPGTGVTLAGFSAARAFGQRRCAFARPALQ
jgi:hypothetical protein